VQQEEKALTKPLSPVSLVFCVGLSLRPLHRPEAIEGESICTWALKTLFT
jgi:hypothetical protein